MLCWCFFSILPYEYRIFKMFTAKKKKHFTQLVWPGLWAQPSLPAWPAKTRKPSYAAQHGWMKLQDEHALHMKHCETVTHTFDFE